MLYYQCESVRNYTDLRTAALRFETQQRMFAELSGPSSSGARGVHALESAETAEEWWGYDQEGYDNSGKDSRKARWLPVLQHAVFSFVQSSNKLGTHVPSDSLQWQEHFKCKAQTLFKPQIYGAGPCQQVRQNFKGK